MSTPSRQDILSEERVLPFIIPESPSGRSDTSMSSNFVNLPRERRPSTGSDGERRVSFTKKVDTIHIESDSGKDEPTHVHLSRALEAHEAEVREMFRQLASDDNKIDQEDLENILEDQIGLKPHLPFVKRVLQSIVTDEDGCISLRSFADLMSSQNIIRRALTGQLAIPDFVDTCTQIVRIYNRVQRSPITGTPVDYIPLLKAMDPELFAVSICTVDGQQFSYGDWKRGFCLEGAVFPFNYALALESSGHAEVHKIVGREPSSKKFNDVSLNRDGRPYNPMLNAGAMAVCGMIKEGKDNADRFSHCTDTMAALAGGKYTRGVHFNQPVYLSEKETGARNKSLAYYMKGKGVFGRDATDEEVENILDLYTQLCSIEVNTETLSVMAASLAFGGVCPLTKTRVISVDSCQKTLSCLFTTGMYDYSGRWAFDVGLPATSGVSGCMFIVVPGVLGLALYSPPLDKSGNPPRAIEFCKLFSRHFNYSVFERIVSGAPAWH